MGGRRPRRDGTRCDRVVRWCLGAWAGGGGGQAGRAPSSTAGPPARCTRREHPLCHSGHDAVEWDPLCLLYAPSTLRVFPRAARSRASAPVPGGARRDAAPPPCRRAVAEGRGTAEGESRGRQQGSPRRCRRGGPTLSGTFLPSLPHITHIPLQNRPAAPVGDPVPTGRSVLGAHTGAGVGCGGVRFARSRDGRWHGSSVGGRRSRWSSRGDVWRRLAGGRGVREEGQRGGAPSRHPVCGAGRPALCSGAACIGRPLTGTRRPPASRPAAAGRGATEFHCLLFFFSAADSSHPRHARPTPPPL